MGDIMAQIGRHKWKFNMLGTTSENRTGAELKEKKASMRKCTYESIIFQHDSEELVLAMWSDNNIVRTLSNFHSPDIVEDGLNRKKKVDGKRERAQTPVPCPQQNKDYSETFHLIDKGNGAAANYIIALESHNHGWTPKLGMRYYNMTCNNAYQVYVSLVHKFTTGRRYYDMPEALDEAAHAFMQRGTAMRTQAAEHPEHLKDVSRMFDIKGGRRLRTDASGYRQVTTHGQQWAKRSTAKLCTLRSYQSRNSWRTHQSVPCMVQGKCAYHGCPNLKKGGRKRNRSYDTYMKCEECSAKNGSAVYYCNNKKGKAIVNCHMRHHMQYQG